MRLPRRVGGQAGISMTPLIDVVFQLLIFFLVTSHLAQQEVHLDLALPRALSGVRPPQQATPEWIIHVQAGGLITVAGRRWSVAELERHLRERAAEADPEMDVRIRSDRNVPYRLVEPILRACARAGVDRVSFSVLLPAESP